MCLKWLVDSAVRSARTSQHFASAFGAWLAKGAGEGEGFCDGLYRVKSTSISCVKSREPMLYAFQACKALPPTLWDEFSTIVWKYELFYFRRVRGEIPRFVKTCRTLLRNDDTRIKDFLRGYTCSSTAFYIEPI
jgi:hypothetical protein